MSFLDKITNHFKSLRIVRKCIYWAKKRSLWGFFNVPVYDVVTFVFQEIKKDSLITRANSIAFSLFLSLFPGILAIITLIPLVLPFFKEFILPYISPDLIVTENGTTNIRATLLNQLNDILTMTEIIPANIVSTFNKFAADLLLEPRIGLFSIGYILALIFSSNGIMQLMRGFEKSSHSSTFKKRNFFKSRLISFKILIILTAIVVLSMISIIIGNYIFPTLFEKLNLSDVGIYFINFLRFFLTLAIFYAGISIIYRNGIATKDKVSFFSAGATLATFLSLSTSFIFAFWVDSFNRYNELYGSIGTIIVLLLWIQINAFILLIGFELNASIAINKSIIENRNYNA